MIETLIITAIVILQGMHDGHDDEGNAKNQHICMLLVTVLFLGLALLTTDWRIVPLYLLARLFVYDIAYNAVRGLDIVYVGRTKRYDRFIRRMFKNFVWWFWIKFCIWAGFTVMINFDPIF